MKVCFIVNTLGYSRRFHFWCSDSQDAEHTYEGLIRSFEYFGGVTEEVLVDNQKAAVLEHRAGAAAQFNARFVDLAGLLRLCAAGLPAVPRAHQRQRRADGRLRQAALLRALPLPSRVGRI